MQGSVIIIGAGIAGIQASLDLANLGFKVYLLEEKPCIGGNMSKLDKTFPTNDCSTCIISPKLNDVSRHPNIEVLVNSKLSTLLGDAGNFHARIIKYGSYVKESDCTGCGDCAEACPIEVLSEFEYGLKKRKAIWRPFPQAVPNIFTVDKQGISPCRVACPADVNAHAYVALIAQGKYKEALEIVRKENPLPGICGRVCTHPCERDCSRSQVEESISICQLKRFVADYEQKGVAKGEFEEAPLPEIQEKKEDKVAIVGSGPAGLTAAYYLALEGYQATIFEELSVVGGMLYTGIPAYRLPREVIEAEVNHIKRSGVEIKTNTTIGKDLTLEDLKKQGYKAIFLAIGAHQGLKLGVPGEDDYEGLLDCITFLRQVNLGDKTKPGSKIIVIGGGNSAIDSARTALRLGCKEVHILYRRSRKEMPAYEEEVEEAEHEGVKIHYLAAPVKILGDKGKVTGMECIKMKLGEPDTSGRRRPVPIEGSEFTIEADCIIPAISQQPDLSFLGEDHNFRLSRWNTFEVDPASLQTNQPGVFAGGDAVSGPATVIEAIAAGKKAALSITKYLRGEPPIEEIEESVPIARPEIDKKMQKNARRKIATLPLEERKESFEEVNLGFTEEEAKDEALRCLNCSVCCECLQCLEACQKDAIDHNMPRERVIDIKAGAVIVTAGYQIFDPTPLVPLGYDRYKNVITSIEYERISAASGPTGGKLIRTSDGKEPNKIAFIQCVGSRVSDIGNEYCSSICCTYAVKESSIAKEHVSHELETTIFFMDMRTHGKDFDKYYERAEKEGVKFVRSLISSVKEVPETNDLTISYVSEDGEAKEETFNMVVLSVGLCPPADVKELADTLGIELNEFGFSRTKESEPLKTSREGIYVAGAFHGPKDIPETVFQSSGAAAEASALLASARGTKVVTKEYPPERDVSEEEPRIGCFICHCGINIGGYVDVPAVTEYAKTLPNIILAEDNLFTCSTDTQQRIVECVREHKLNRVIIASCSPRTHEPLFQETMKDAGLNPYLFELANIRDQDSWIHMREPDEATLKAKDLVRMAAAKARLLEPLTTFYMDVKKSALVIGGGLAGMTAAQKIAEQGYEAYLVEKEKELGGNLRHLHYTLDGLDVQAFLKKQVEKVKNNPKIRIYTSTKISNMEGFIGNYVTTISQNGKAKKLEHGVSIVATGAKESVPKEYLYDENDKVITQLELEKKIVSGELQKEKPATVVMIQCVGSRDDERPYCSRICCSEAIKNALKIKEQSPDTDIFILYRDIRTYGFKEIHYKQARLKWIKFLRYDKDKKPVVGKDAEGLKVEVIDQLLKQSLIIRPNYLVLSAAIEPSVEENEELAKMLKIPLNDERFFLEAHVKLRPVDFATEGIFLAGIAHNPKSIEETIAQANASAARACTIISKDKYQGEPIICQVDEDSCRSCGRCVEVCQFQASQLVKLETGRTVARVNPVVCKGCGVCCAACPSAARAIKALHFTDAQIEAMLAASVQKESSEKKTKGDDI